MQQAAAAPVSGLAISKLDLTKLAKITFDRKGISIPFPQQEVVYRDATAARQ